MFAPSLRYVDFSKGMLFGSQQPFVGGALREDRKNGCEADYAFGKLVIMSLVPEKPVGMPK